MKKSMLIVMVVLSLCYCMIGCGKQSDNTNKANIQENGNNTENIGHVSINTESGDAVIFAKDEDSFPVSIFVLNVSGVDIGMMSIIDPATKEQLNISGLPNETSMAINANWPKDESELSWALYNMNGELCVEGKSDFTGIKKSATIIFSGDGNVTGIDVQVN